LQNSHGSRKGHFLYKKLGKFINISLLQKNHKVWGFFPRTL